MSDYTEGQKVRNLKSHNYFEGYMTTLDDKNTRWYTKTYAKVNGITPKFKGLFL